MSFWRSRKNRLEVQGTIVPAGLEQWAENPRSALRSRSKRLAAPGTDVFKHLVGRTRELIQRLRIVVKQCVGFGREIGPTYAMAGRLEAFSELSASTAYGRWESVCPTLSENFSGFYFCRKVSFGSTKLG
jgi:hypothetical protein